MSDYIIDQRADGRWTVTDPDTGKAREFYTWAAAVRWAEQDWTYWAD